MEHCFVVRLGENNKKMKRTKPKQELERKDKRTPVERKECIYGERIISDHPCTDNNETEIRTEVTNDSFK